MERRHSAELVDGSGVFAASRSSSTSPRSKTGILNNAPIFNLADSKYYNGATFDGFVERPAPAVQPREQLVPDAGRARPQRQGRLRLPEPGIRRRSSTIPNRQFYIVDNYIQATKTPVFGPNSSRRGLRLGPVDFDRQDPRVLRARQVRGQPIGFRSKPACVSRSRPATATSAASTVDATVLAPRLSGTYDLSGDGKTLAHRQLRPLPREHHPGLLGCVRAGGAAGQLRQLRVERQRVRVLEPRPGQRFELHAEPRSQAVARGRSHRRVPASDRTVDGRGRALHPPRAGATSSTTSARSTPTARSTARSSTTTRPSATTTAFSSRRRSGSRTTGTPRRATPTRRPKAITSATTSRRWVTTSTRNCRTTVDLTVGNNGVIPVRRGPERREQERLADRTTGRTTSRCSAHTCGRSVRSTSTSAR